MQYLHSRPPIGCPVSDPAKLCQKEAYDKDRCRSNLGCKTWCWWMGRGQTEELEQKTILQEVVNLPCWALVARCNYYVTEAWAKPTMYASCKSLATRPVRVECAEFGI